MLYVELECYMQINISFLLHRIDADVYYVLINVVFVNVVVYCCVSVYRCLPGKWKRLSR